MLATSVGFLAQMGWLVAGILSGLRGACGCSRIPDIRCGLHRSSRAIYDTPIASARSRAQLEVGHASRRTLRELFETSISTSLFGI
ncbi:hypothetical protein C8J56DRAFT_931705 [Mycena floridula]|nr:hypothetical protein C8J56DRAFT_931705 [Mycena floridula]